MEEAVAVKSKDDTSLAHDMRVAAQEAAALGLIIDILPMDVLDKLYSFSNWGTVVLFPKDDGREEAVAVMRKVYGALMKEGFAMEHKKIEQNGDETMQVYATQGAIKFRLDSWMAKTCKVVEETIVVPAVEAHMVEAQPERTVTRRRIVCENE